MRRAAPSGAETAAMRSYALQQTRTLLRRLAFQVNQTGRLSNAESVQDLLAAIRRFSQSLRVFEQYLPKVEVRKIRHKLKAVLGTAAAVRDCDITVELWRNAGLPLRVKAMTALADERKQAERELLSAIRQWSRDNFSGKWRARLEL